MNLREDLETILAYPRLKEYLTKNPIQKNDVTNYLKEIRTSYKQMMIRFVGLVLDHTLMKLYDGIEVESLIKENLKELTAKNFVVFVPNHQSHADYLVLNYILHRKFDVRPLIAGGLNLNVFPIGRIFRNSGCFFIRRTFGRNILYKLVLESYVASLLKRGYPLEFFYEGGRSRTGKLLAPKYGLFQIILDIYDKMDIAEKKPLLFIPVSIVHEIVPEHKSLVREMEGAKKKKESFGQVLKLYRFLSKRFGTVYVKIGSPIEVTPPIEDSKKRTQSLAIDCYRSVGRGMTLTGQSLLGLIFLDGSKSSITHKEIIDRAIPIIDFCKKFQIPLADALREEGSQLEKTVDNSLNLYLKNGRVKRVNNQLLREEYFTLNEESRMEVLFSKNSILHHFIAPFLINMSWVGVFNGRIMNVQELEAFLLDQRERLKYEFYLPTVKELFQQAIAIIGQCVGRPVTSLGECFLLNAPEMYAIARCVAPFGNAFRYIYECYYLTAETLRFFQGEEFTEAEFLKIGKEVFKLQQEHGRLVKHGESFALPTIRNAFNYLINRGVIQTIDRDTDEDKSKKGRFKISDLAEIDRLRSKYARDLTDLLFLNYETFPN